MTDLKRIFLLISLALSSCLYSQAQGIYQSGNPCKDNTMHYILTSGCSNVRWSVSGVSNKTSNASNTSIDVQWQGVGTGYVTASASGCQPGMPTYYSVSTNVVSKVTPTVVITSSVSSACLGTPVTFSVSSKSFQGTSPNYSWYVDGVYAGGGASESYTTNSLSASNHTVYATMTSNETCVTQPSATSNTLSITISQPPAFSIVVQGSPICSGQNASFTANAVPSSYVSTYKWKRNNSYVTDNVSPIPNIYSTSTPVNNGDKITCEVTTTQSCLPGVYSGDFYATVTNPTPASLGIGSNKNSFCEGDEVTFSANSNGTISNYRWSLSGTVSESGTGSTFTTRNFKQGSGVSLTANVTGSGCMTSGTLTANSSAIPITVTPTVTPTITLDQNPVVCSGDAVTFTSHSSNGGSLPTYKWYLDNNYVGGGSGSTYSPGTISVGTHTVKVIMSSSMGCVTNTDATSNTVSTEIKEVKPLGASIQQPPSICQGQSSSYFLKQQVTGSTSYTWTINNKSEGSNSNIFIPNEYIQNGDIIACKVNLNESCVSGNNTTVSLTVNNVQQTVPATLGIGPNKNSFCEGDEVTFSANSNGTISNYRWSLSGTVYESGTGSTFTTRNFKQGSVVSLTANVTGSGCTSSGTLTAVNTTPITVIPNVVPEFAININEFYLGKVTLCGVASAHLWTYVNKATASNYRWTLNGQTVGGDSPVFTTDQLSNGSTVTVTADVGGACLTTYTVSATLQNINVVNIPITQPVISIEPSSQNVCENEQVAFTASSTNATTSNFRWMMDSDLVLVNYNASIFTADHVKQGSIVKVTADVSGECLSSLTASATYVISTKPLPKAIITPSGLLTIGTFCSQLIQATEGAGYTYQWMKNGINITNADSSSYSAFEPGDYSVNVLSDGCASVSPHLLLTKDLIPAGNCIIETFVLEKSVSSESSIPALTVSEKSVIKSYFDGLGRLVQKVSWQASPSMQDIVQPVIYDEFGREELKYLPYTNGADGSFKTNVSSAQLNFYNNPSDNIPDDAYPFSKTVFENSSLNRVLKQGAPGASWQPDMPEGHPATFDYLTDNTGEVLNWHVSIDNSCQQLGYYAPGELSVMQTSDENQHSVREYKDKQGKVILKASKLDGTWLQTYYIYDELDLLRYVLSPEATAKLTTNTVLTQGSDIIKKYGYYYQYDQKKRMIVKQLPGADPVYMVYDQRDRLVLTQDATVGETDRSQWMFTKYDALDRPIITGLYNGGTKTRDQLQNEVNLFTGDSLYENLGQGAHGYTLNSFPKQDINEYLSVNYYDCYPEFDPIFHFYDQAKIDDYTSPDSSKYFGRLLGQLTGKKVKVLGTGNWLQSLYFYDDKLRVIQAVSNNHMVNGYDVVSTRYDFTGKVMETRNEQHLDLMGTQPYTLLYHNYNTYDHSGRLIKTEQMIEGDTYNKRVTLDSMKYNELGQLIEKDLHGNLQSIDYKYNIRGWLTGMNKPDLSDNGTGHAHPDLFGMELFYNNTISGLSQVDEAQYNGNIAAVKWKLDQDATTKAYAYRYDGINRLLRANYGEAASGWNNTRYDVTGRNAEPYIGYDKNGNILSMGCRNGLEGTNNWLDNFHYRYDGNRLMALGKDGNNAPANNTYDYYASGNLKYDTFKRCNMYYNVLNLPCKVLFKDSNNYINYTYDASGIKLRKETYTKGILTSTTDYVGNSAYTDGAFNYLITAEGRVTKPTSNFVYEYHLKDHLGNTRVTFDASSPTSLVVKQRADYYPFGLRFNGGLNNDNKYLYNGKEWQDDFELNWYDYGARFYDPQIGRFTTQDPHSEKYHTISPYTYCANNPIALVDPDGQDFAIYIDKDKDGHTTIRVTATYYVQKGDADTKTSAEKATKFWNDKSGQFAVNSGDKDNPTQTNINFDLKVVEVDDPQAALRQDQAGDEKSITKDGSSNIYSLTDKNYGDEKGTCSGLRSIEVKSDNKNDLTGAHEVGHSLGLPDEGTSSSSIMNGGAGQTWGSVDRQNVRGILKYGTQNSNKNPHRLGVYGTLPNGKVKEKK